MRDPRIVLKDELIAIGILSKQASIIALDTGSSQAIVNPLYEGYILRTSYVLKRLCLLQE